MGAAAVAAQPIKQFAKRTVMTLIRAVIGKVVRASANGAVRKLVADRVQDLVLQQFLDATRKELQQYVNELNRSGLEIERRLNAAFGDDLMGAANINIIGPAIANVGGYEGDVLPHELFELMNLTIQWGRHEADLLWDRCVNQQIGGQWLNVLMGAGPGADAWAFGVDFGPAIRRVEQKQREWVEERRRSRAAQGR